MLKKWTLPARLWVARKILSASEKMERWALSAEEFERAQNVEANRIKLQQRDIEDDLMEQGIDPRGSVGRFFHRAYLPARAFYLRRTRNQLSKLRTELEAERDLCGDMSAASEAEAEADALEAKILRSEEKLERIRRMDRLGR